MQKLTVQSDKCNACGMCALECEILQENSAGIVEVVGNGIVADSDAEKIAEIVSLCPTGALNLEKIKIDAKARLAEIKSQLQAPLEFNPPPKEDYEFRLEDKDEYAEAIQDSLSISGEYEYDYSSASSAESAGRAAFRDEIYSQVDALAQQVIAMYEQRRINKVARYAEIDTNYKFGVHKKLAGDLRAFVTEIESLTGKKISLPQDFYAFKTRDTDYINDRQDHANEWLAESIRDKIDSASEFYHCIKTDREYEYVTVSHFFGDDTRENKYTYAYYLNHESSGLRRFYNQVARATWKSGKYTSRFCEEELRRFHKDIEAEWKGKISYLLKQF